MSSVQKATNDALIDLREQMKSGSDPTVVIPKLASEYGIKPDSLWMRSEKLRNDPEMLKFKDPEYRDEVKRKETIRSALSKGDAPDNAGEDWDGFERMKIALGAGFTEEEKNEIIINGLVEKVRDAKRK